MLQPASALLRPNKQLAMLPFSGYDLPSHRTLRSDVTFGCWQFLVVINLYWQLFVSFAKAAVQYLLAGLADVTPIFTIFLVQLFCKQIDSSCLKWNRRAGLEGPPTCAYTSRLSLEGGREGGGATLMTAVLETGWFTQPCILFCFLL